MNGNGYGMPSSHAQFVTFFTLYLTLFLLLRHVPSPHAPTPSPLCDRLLLSLLALSCAAVVAASRVYLNYHTPRQVLAGCYAGAVLAVGWFVVTAWLRRNGWVAWGLETDLARMFRVRDLVVEEDLADAGWARWQEALRRKGK
jgi:dolichyldiphosphatase